MGKANNHVKPNSTTNVAGTLNVPGPCQVRSHRPVTMNPQSQQPLQFPPKTNRILKTAEDRRG